MNERTKAIGRQAGLVFIEDGVYGQRWYSSRCGLDAAEYQKLVELIVRECMKQGDVLVKHYIDTHTEQEQALLLASIADYTNEIKKHFGVEE